MAKEQKKSNEEASKLFQNVIGASVSGNPKPKKNVMKDFYRSEYNRTDGECFLIAVYKGVKEHESTTVKINHIVNGNTEQLRNYLIASENIEDILKDAGDKIQQIEIKK